MPYKNVLHVLSTLATCKFFISDLTKVEHACCQCTYILKLIKKALDDGSNGLKHVAHCYMAFKCCV